MGEKSIKEMMDERFGGNQIPRRQVSRDEMDKLIAEAKERGKTKGERKKLTKGEQRRKNTEIDRMDNYPCPGCKEIKWMKVPDSSGRYYCLKCGEVIELPCIDTDAKKEVTDSNKTPAQVSQCDETETKVDQINPFNEPIPETGNDGRIFCEYRCNDCQEIVVASGNSLERAKNLVAFHKGCGKRLIFVRKINPKLAVNKERFSHPKVEKALCNDCFYDMSCPRTFKRIISCLLRDVVYNIKKFRSD
jgi:hypothetical protein